MKTLLIHISLLIICFTSFGQQQQFTYPTLKKTGQTIESFVPEGWFILAQTSGDLNQDGKKDIAIVVQNKDPKFVISIGKGDNAVEYDSNHRILIILFQTAKGTYTLADYHNTFIWRNMSPNRIDPFLGIAIDDKGGKKGVLLIDFHFYYVTEVNESTIATYKFRHQNNNFELIGAEKTDIMKNSGSSNNYSFNFLSRKMVTTKRNSNTANKESSKDEKFELKTLKNFRTLYQPFNDRLSPNNQWLVNGVNL